MDRKKGSAMSNSGRGTFLYIGVIALFLIIAVSSVTYVILQRRRRQSSSPTLPPGIEQGCTLEAMLCPDGTAVGRTGPNCEFAPCPVVTSTDSAEESDACFPANLTIAEPQAGESISFPFTVTGAVDNRKNKECSWGVFEAQAGTIVVKDENGEIVGTGILETKGEWMTEGPVQVEGTVTATKPTTSKTLNLIVTEEDPSGLGEVQQLTIELSQK